MAFNTRVILHIAGIILVTGLLAYCLFNTQYYATMLTLFLILCLQIAALLRYVTTTNRQLTRFLQAVTHADFSQSFRNRGLGRSFTALGQAFDELIQRFRRERSDKENQAVYLNAFVEQIPIAVFALHEDGRISICNSAFRRLLGVQAISHLKQLEGFNKMLAQACRSLTPGRTQSLQIQTDTEQLVLNLSCSILRKQGKQQKLISIQNIQSALEAKEIQTWQNLIRVMTHEIMNSITPITSLADTAKQYLQGTRYHLEKDAAGIELTSELDDIEDALNTISNRGQGLMRFVESYRSLTRLPTPNIRMFRVQELFTSCSRLMEEQARQQGVNLEFLCSPETLQLHADPDLLEQALINLLRNSIEACEAAPDARITVTATLRDRGRVELRVTDNGKGMDKEQQENIFIPFYTTKRGGSGIGMSIVKQIVQLNAGSIRIETSAGHGTAVIVVF